MKPLLIFALILCLGLAAGPALTPEELAAQRFLYDTAVALPAAQEDEYWAIGGDQFGNLSKRYQVAFSGYAAAALGMRTPAYPGPTMEILQRCIDRMLPWEVWRYAESYWKSKPWFPDPCYRENIMYTGHLLQLMAFYEAFGGGRRYWETGFDFVWKDGRRTHYDLAKLIAVTVAQMEANPSGGVSCEPGLIFFPCNNHLQLALLMWERQGRGDWSSLRAKWETWALENYLHPALGGGALKLAYSVKTHLMIPRGHPGLDGWSMLWYQPWTKDMAVARQIWQDSVKRLDWAPFQQGVSNDVIGEKASCANPANVPPAATASFLDASARAFGDAQTAAGVEKYLDQFLKTDHGWYRLETDRRWRMGCTANRILALALEHGSDLRGFVQEKWPDYAHKLYLSKMTGAAVTVADWDGDALCLTLVDCRDAVLTLANCPAPLNVQASPQCEVRVEKNMVRIPGAYPSLQLRLW